MNELITLLDSKITLFITIIGGFYWLGQKIDEKK